MTAVWFLAGMLGAQLFIAIWQDAPPAIITAFAVGTLVVVAIMSWWETWRYMDEKSKRVHITTSRRREWD